MIFVERTKTPASLDLADPESAASKELAELKAHWEEKKSAPGGDSYKAYAAADVREALTALFKGKCAYCESPVSGSSQTDIEHYRPKGGVTEAAEAGIDHPGYWWLAMKWENLVLGCMHCNQARRQLILEPEMSEAEIRAAIERNDLQTTGKKNAFPTEGNQWITDFQGELSDEKPLLIDPTVVDPEPLFEWVLAGSISTLRPRDGEARADRTIKVLGLNRRYLTEARVQILDHLIVLGDSIRVGLEDFQNARTDGEAAIALRAVKRDLEAVRDLGLPGRPYAGLARAFLARMEALVQSML